MIARYMRHFGCSLSVLLLLSFSLSAQTPDGTDPGTGGTPGTGITGALDFGFGVQINRPYQATRGTATATVFFFNFSGQDTEGAWVNPGGLGCRYRIVVRDAKGNVVWNPHAFCPLTTRGGFAPIGPFPMPDRTMLQLPNEIPLVYDNSDTPDPDGVPLPGGAYMLEADHDFSGPAHPEGKQLIGIGGRPSAAIPFRIIECGEPSGVVPSRDVDKGGISAIHYGKSDFYGEDFVLRTPEAAMAFWNAHTSNQKPRPAPPAVNWETEMVLVSIMGFQTTGGGPAIEIQEVREEACHLNVTVVSYHLPGMLDVITNPFHIVAVPRSLKEVHFEHLHVVP